jgi:bifunctional N-acetylglucosamine-1-phosphate-uridyltransferase/glucosamine-1-phosphate-acetyltransferase GlmU-like protein
MWGFKPELFSALQKGFVQFLSDLGDNELKKEYLLPTVVGEMVKSHEVEVSVLKTSDRWFGVTYKEDKEAVVKSFKALIDKGDYPSRLYSK